MKKVIAAYVLSNTASVNIYEVIDGDCVIAGINNEEPKEYEIQYTLDEEGLAFFKMGELEIPLNECMRIGGY